MMPRMVDRRPAAGQAAVPLCTGSKWGTCGSFSSEHMSL